MAVKWNLMPETAEAIRAQITQRIRSLYERETEGLAPRL